MKWPNSWTKIRMPRTRIKAKAVVMGNAVGLVEKRGE
jgi:hypothetical protein